MPRHLRSRPPVSRSRRRPDDSPRRQANPWMIIGWIVLGGILMLLLLVGLSFCGVVTWLSTRG